MVETKEPSAKRELEQRFLFSLDYEKMVHFALLINKIS